MYEKIKRWYALDLWSAAMVGAAVIKGLLRTEEMREILGEETNE